MLMICNVNMFALNQTILVGEEKLHIPLNGLGATIAKIFASNNEIDEIHLYGDEQFLSNIVADIEFSYNAEYNKSLKNLKIEVNK